MLAGVRKASDGVRMVSSGKKELHDSQERIRKYIFISKKKERKKEEEKGKWYSWTELEDFFWENVTLK